MTLLPNKTRHDSGFVVLVVLLVLATLGLAIWVAAQNQLRRTESAQDQVLQTRLDLELAHELRRLEASASKAKSPEALWTQAHGNLLKRGLRDLESLESQRRQLKGVAEDRLTGRQRDERRQLLQQLDRDIRLARRWVQILQSRIEAS